jgi:hypothetical protein
MLRVVLINMERNFAEKAHGVRTGGFAPAKRE